MAKSLKRLLAEPNDSELCDNLHARIVEYHGDDIDPSVISEPERVVLLVWHVSGIIGNGGFRYLFGGNLKGDPYFALTAEAFRAIGCRKATEAVCKTLALFPNSQPSTNIDERLRYYLKRCKVWPTDMDMLFMDADADLKKCLANYIRSHANAFLHLDNPKPEPPPKKKPRPAKAAAKPKKTGPSLADLPRWARVAFAARCARRVFPLLAQSWAAVPAKKANAVRVAIDLAEQSAAEGEAIAGLRNAVTQAMMTAGAALGSHPKFAAGRLGPENAYAGAIASSVAKAAEKAAESALAEGEKSLLAAREGWDFATTAAAYADEGNIEKELQGEFLKLHQAAIRGKWTDRTKIPPEIWSLL